MLKIYNTLSGQLERFVPIDKNNVKMYICGPTVYDRAHIGNARSAVVFDVLYRILKALYNDNVTYVRNITDIDDKIYNAAIERNITVSQLTSSTIKMYHEDMDRLNILPVNIEPRATEHIQDIIFFIEKLIKNDNAYVTENHVYFDISSVQNYGAFSKKRIEELIAGERVEISDLKRGPLDFVLWKPIDDKMNFGWESPWGIGRPGWHIECSAMSKKYLGEVFDIHGGGIDLVFPHHENEIAQSCAISGQKFMANYWIHNGHLNVDGTKMSKSIGNFYTLNDLLAEYNGEVIRMAFLMTHYSSPMNFNFEALRQSKTVLDRWYTAIRDVQLCSSNGVSNEIFDVLCDNMNTSRALSLLNEIVAEINKTQNKREIVTIFVNTCQKFLGLMMNTPNDWFCNIEEKKKVWIESKIHERETAKKNKNYVEADSIRAELEKNRILLEDTIHGTTWKIM
ncbi:MAG: cysteine--tRNA ligase [Holosporales bacterium]|jgi:cysteinyl-tRNA synthetase|nr:cysteine--tRNA ligase [Holosporales bacterium]